MENREDKHLIPPTIIGEITFARFRAQFELLDDGDRLPFYLGSTIRGLFGREFKRLCCPFRGSECATCRLRQGCSYAYVFETPVGEDAAMMRLYPHAPRPYTFDLPYGSGEKMRKSDIFECGFTLIGKAVGLLPYVVCTLDTLAERGLGAGRVRMRLDAVDCFRADGSMKRCYDSRKRRAVGGCEPLSLAQIGFEDRFGQARRLRLRFLTSVRIVYSGSLCRALPFHVFVRNLLRRASALSYFHCGKRLELDFTKIIRQAQNISQIRSELKWQRWKRYSSRQGVLIDMGGLVGEAEYCGEALGQFHALLRLGEIVHVGKGATFGLGRYEVVPV